MDWVIFDGGRAGTFADGCVWAQMGTIGVAANLAHNRPVGQPSSRCHVRGRTGAAPRGAFGYAELRRAELPGIKHRRAYDNDPPPHPDWRITCLFVDKRHRGQGIARAALAGALDQIAQLGGGLVEAISEVTTGRQAQGRFLFSATVELFEQNGFTRVRKIGKHAWIVSRVIEPARAPGNQSSAP